MNGSKVRAILELTPPVIIGFNKTYSYYFRHVLYLFLYFNSIKLMNQSKVNEISQADSTSDNRCYRYPEKGVCHL